MATTAIIVGIIVAGVIEAAAAGTAAYMQSRAAAAEADARKKEAKLRAQQEEALANAQAENVRMRRQRLISAQRAAASKAGVEADSGSLLVDAMEAAQLNEYEAQSAKYPGVLRTQAARYEEKLFGWRKRNIQDEMWMNVTLATVGSAAGTTKSALGAYGGGGTGGSYSSGASGGLQAA